MKLSSGWFSYFQKWNETLKCFISWYKTKKSNPWRFHFPVSGPKYNSQRADFWVLNCGFILSWSQKLKSNPLRVHFGGGGYFIQTLQGLKSSFLDLFLVKWALFRYKIGPCSARFFFSGVAVNQPASYLRTQSNLRTSLRSYVTDRSGSNLRTSLRSYVTDRS